MQNTLVLLPLDEEYRKRIMAASQGKSDVIPPGRAMNIFLLCSVRMYCSVTLSRKT